MLDSAKIKKVRVDGALLRCQIATRKYEEVSSIAALKIDKFRRDYWKDLVVVKIKMETVV